MYAYLRIMYCLTMKDKTIKKKGKNPAINALLQEPKYHKAY